MGSRGAARTEVRPGQALNRYRRRQMELLRQNVLLAQQATARGETEPAQEV